jgi:hypothetical protein
MKFLSIFLHIPPSIITWVSPQHTNHAATARSACHAVCQHVHNRSDSTLHTDSHPFACIRFTSSFRSAAGKILLYLFFTFCLFPFLFTIDRNLMIFLGKLTVLIFQYLMLLLVSGILTWQRHQLVHEYLRRNDSISVSFRDSTFLIADCPKQISFISCCVQ